MGMRMENGRPSKENDRAGGFYLAFSSNTPKRQVVARFKQRYGRQPERVFPANPGLIMAGPIPENANA